MTRRVPVEPAPGPLEDYAESFDDLLANRAQREGFRCYLEGLLLPAERNKTLTALANTEPIAGAQRKEAQSLQWFLSESRWDPEEINTRRIELLDADGQRAPTDEGVLVIDEHGDRKWGKKTAPLGLRQFGGQIFSMRQRLLPLYSFRSLQGSHNLKPSAAASDYRRPR